MNFPSYNCTIKNIKITFLVFFLLTAVHVHKKIDCSICSIQIAVMDNATICKQLSTRDIYYPPETMHSELRAYCMPVTVQYIIQSVAQYHMLYNMLVCIYIVQCDFTMHDQCSPAFFQQCSYSKSSFRNFEYTRILSNSYTKLFCTVTNLKSFLWIYRFLFFKKDPPPPSY